MQKGKTLGLLAGIIAFLLVSRYGCFYAQKQYDTVRRPWAYSNDTAQPLLVGAWQGTCTDADGVVHQVSLEIFEPLSDEKRWKRMGKPHKKRSRSSPTFFDGIAVIDTKGRKDSCEIWGGLDKADGKEIHFQLRPFNDHHPAGFNLNTCEGTWNGNTLDLSAGFSWFREDGSSFSDSADPRYDYKGKLLMSRRTQQ